MLMCNGALCWIVHIVGDPNDCSDCSDCAIAVAAADNEASAHERAQTALLQIWLHLYLMQTPK